MVLNITRYALLALPTRCNTLHVTSPHCNTLQHTHLCIVLQLTANTLRHAATCTTANGAQHHEICVVRALNTLQHTAPHCTTPQHAHTRCNTLHVTAPHCITLQHAHLGILLNIMRNVACTSNALQHIATHTSTHNNTQRHAAIHTPGCDAQYHEIYVARASTVTAPQLAA